MCIFEQNICLNIFTCFIILLNHFFPDVTDTFILLFIHFMIMLFLLMFLSVFQCEMIFNSDRNMTYSCVYVPSMEGEYRVC